jgi:hypothetical protein
VEAIYAGAWRDLGSEADGYEDELMSLSRGNGHPKPNQTLGQSLQDVEDKLQNSVKRHMELIRKEADALLEAGIRDFGKTQSPGEAHPTQSPTPQTGKPLPKETPPAATPSEPVYSLAKAASPQEAFGIYSPALLKGLEELEKMKVTLNFFADPKSDTYQVAVAKGSTPLATVILPQNAQSHPHIPNGNSSKEFTGRPFSPTDRDEIANEILKYIDERGVGFGCWSRAAMPLAKEAAASAYQLQ